MSDIRLILNFRMVELEEFIEEGQGVSAEIRPECFDHCGHKSRELLHPGNQVLSVVLVQLSEDFNGLVLVNPLRTCCFFKEFVVVRLEVHRIFEVWQACKINVLNCLFSCWERVLTR